MQFKNVYQNQKMKSIDLKTHCFACNKRYIILLLVLTAIILAFIVILPAVTISFNSHNQTWSDSFLYPTKTIMVDGTALNVAIAQTPSEVTQGLSDRQKLKKTKECFFYLEVRTCALSG